MKFNVYTKILIVFIVFFAIFFMAFFKFSKSVESDIVTNASKTTSQGVLISLEKNLINNPKSNWNKIIKSNADNGIYIISTHDLKLTSTQKNKLDTGEIVFTSGATYQFLNLVIVEHTAYKKIGNTSYALVYYFSNPAQFIIHYMNPAIKLIVKDLLSKPENMWNEEALHLGIIYGFPLHVYKNKSNKLPSNIINSLKTRKLVFETNKHTSQIGVIYYAFDDGILKIGPLSYLPITARISDVMYYFILAFFILSLCLIILLSLLFVRNIKKIYQTTENFSHGNFNFRAKVGTASVLYGLYTNINVMGEKLHQLIESKKNMSRFVAHEIRTPLYTMQLALDAIVDIRDLPAETDNYIVSLKDDVKQLNELVALFLLYSQSSTHELKIKKERLNLKNWLKAIIERHQLSNTKIQFNLTGSDDMDAYFDPKLLRHAVENIIVNAVKFANSKVMVSLLINQKNIMISIDDDGPGIVDADREKAFEAFSTLGQSESFGGHIGLGLSIAKSIVQLHSGRISIDHSPFGGCLFVIELPNASL
ncbi:MAG: sensor histidine kinase [Proteobacteria bacterium]|nr:sensor histidine kinase [Pseudomonadota bacterium]